MTSLFRCPLCSAPLTRGEQGYLCPSGHCFDVAAAGYTHLLPANRKHSKNPGDDKAMVAARSAFLDRGYYIPLRDALCARVTEECKALPSPALLDSGCGEGYYTAGLYQTLTQAGCAPQIAGVDISKFALRRAAKRLPQGEFAVASVYHLPLADQSVDALVNVFSPLAPEEFARVLRKNGRLLVAVPGKRHLWELKEAVYETPYRNDAAPPVQAGLSLVEEEHISAVLHLARHEDIANLFQMTPYAHKTGPVDAARLDALDTLDVTAAFVLRAYRRD